jgi:hypothetical protein
MDIGDWTGIPLENGAETGRRQEKKERTEWKAINRRPYDASVRESVASYAFRRRHCNTDE